MKEQRQKPKRGLELEYTCRNCTWKGGRGDLDTDQCPECGSFDIETQRW